MHQRKSVANVRLRGLLREVFYESLEKLALAGNAQAAIDVGAVNLDRAFGNAKIFGDGETAVATQDKLRYRVLGRSKNSAENRLKDQFGIATAGMRAD